MPLLKLQTSVSLSEDKKKELLLASSGIIARVTGKPESYVMTVIESANICMAGKVGPAAFVEVRGIGGLNAKVNQQLSKEISDLLKQELNIKPDSVYLNFTEVSAQNWGWNGGTFG